MVTQRVIRIGKRGTLVLPSDLRRSHELGEHALVIVEEREDGILLRPAVAVPTSEVEGS